MSEASSRPPIARLPVRRPVEIDHWLPAFVGAYLLLALLVSLAWPWGRDQGIFAWVADVILAGGLPYRDAFDVKGPATYLPYVAAAWVAPRSLVAIRVVDAFLLLSAMLAAAVLLRRGSGWLSAVSAACLVAAFHLGGGYWDTAQPDAWAGWCVLGALVLIDERAGRVRLFGAGVLAGLTPVLKLPLGLLAAAPLLLLLGRRGAGPSRGPGVACFAAGLASPGVAVLLWFGFSGGLPALLDVQLGFNTEVHAAAHARSVLEHGGEWLRILLDPATALLLPLAWLGLRELRSRQCPLGNALVVFGIAAAAAVTLQDKYYDYHRAPFAIPIAILAARGLGQLANGRSSVWAGAVLAGAVLLALPPTRLLEWWPGGEVSASERGIHPLGGYSLPQLEGLARQLRARTGEEETIALFGFDAGLYALAGRRSATRFGYVLPFAAGPEDERAARYAEEYSAALARARPAFFVLAREDSNNLLREPSAVLLERFPRLRSWIAREYAPARRGGAFHVWQRRLEGSR